MNTCKRLTVTAGNLPAATRRQTGRPRRSPGHGRALGGVIAVCAAWLASSTAGPAEGVPGEIVLRQALVVRSGGHPTRSVVRTDPLEARLVLGQWRAPAAGEPLAPGTADRTWAVKETDQDGWLPEPGPGGGWAYWAVPSDREQILLLEAAGHNAVYVNGEIRAGDPYANGSVHLPVRLHPGTNDFLFPCSRGRLRARLVPPTGPLALVAGDSTLPDLVVGERGPLRGAVLVLNSTTNFLSVALRAKGPRNGVQTVVVPPLSLRKAPFIFYASSVKVATNYCPLRLEATARSEGRALRAEVTLGLRLRRPDQACKRTFLSPIDGSVQYYAVQPAASAAGRAPGAALFLSLHGAGVEAIGQAEAYSPKRWGNIVCPTNRRPFGFDWEEWGRKDALEVLEAARAELRPDPARIYLTGHSMGGHGTWQLGALYPDHFAAIGPSAGWISFTSYTERDGPKATNALQQMLARAAATGDTLLMATNYLQEGIYILHGDADDNVPVTEAREMRRQLGTFHRDFDFHEQPGAGHWWDASDEPGADCVDWAPLFDFFARHAIPADTAVRRVRFVTVNPAVSARDHWVTVQAQEQSQKPSAVDIRCDPGKRRFVGTTTNVARLCLALPLLEPGAPLAVELDGQKLDSVPWPTCACCAACLCLVRDHGRWQPACCPPSTEKNCWRSGPFREAFDRRVLLVFGTRATPEENAWALAKARFDAETFWYRGNGSLELMSDVAFVEKANTENARTNAAVAGRNVVLYGNADGNAAWSLLLGQSPVQVRRGSVRIGGRELTGNDLACVFLRPNPRDDRGLVGVVCGSGLPGLRLTDRMPFFLSGAGFPDCLVAGPDLLTDGLPGLRAAGFFGLDWGVDSGEFAWRE